MIKVPTMTGEFVQFGPNGEQTGGEFLIKRPGKIRFNYENPSPITVVSNGRTLAVENKKLKTTILKSRFYLIHRAKSYASGQLKMLREKKHPL